MKQKMSSKNILLLKIILKKQEAKREAHQAAHLLEHYVSEEVIGNIKKLYTLKKEGVPLTKFELNNEGIITDLMFSDYGLFERIVSMGVSLGEEIMITNEVPHALIVKIKNKKFALDKDIAKEIKVVKYEKP